MKSDYTYKPGLFFSIVFLITWIAGAFAAYYSYQEGTEGIQLLLILLGMCAPLLGVLFMLFLSGDKALWKDFGGKLSLRRIKLAYLPAILLIMPVTVFLATALSLLFGQSVDQFKLSSEFQIISGQVVVSVLILFLAPTLEELGWRGYGVDSLRSKYDLFRTTLLFGFLWAMWHLPLFFINGYYQHELWVTNVIYAINFFVSILPATILMNWMYYKNNRSISAAILFHFVLNLFSVLFQTDQFTKCIVTVLLIALSIYIIIKDKEFFFDEKPNFAQPKFSLEASQG